MALFPNSNSGLTYDGGYGKTHTNLVVSEGMAPAETFVVAADNDFTPFLYEYGPEGNQMVVVPKGKIVESNGSEFDRETGYNRTAIRVAKENSERVLGVNQHNIYESERGSMTGTRGTVITRNYIEVPLFEHADVKTAEQYAKAMSFGAAYGIAGGLNAGDYVVTGSNGNFKKYNKDEHTPEMIVGQVWAADRDLPPMGFLQYYMDIDNAEFEAYIKQISNPASPGGSGYPYGAPYTVKGWKKDFLKKLGGEKPTGIPFLTDGFFRAQERISATLVETDKNVEAVRVNEVVTHDKATGAVTVVEGKDVEGFVYVKLAHKLNLRKLDGVEVSYTVTTGEGEEATTETIKLSPKDVKAVANENAIAIYLAPGTYEGLTIGVDAIVNPIAGLPTEWDHAGSTGAVRILLQK